MDRAENSHLDHKSITKLAVTCIVFIAVLSVFTATAKSFYSSSSSDMKKIRHFYPPFKGQWVNFWEGFYL